MSSQEPIWHVDIDGQVYETELETLKRGIAEGRVLAVDPVRKGTLSWIAANRVPALRGLFPEGEASLASSIRAPQGQEPLAPVSHSGANPAHVSLAQETRPNAIATPPPIGTWACHNHPDRPPAYRCRVCCETFCSDCPE